MNAVSTVQGFRIKAGHFKKGEKKAGYFVIVFGAKFWYTHTHKKI